MHSLNLNRVAKKQFPEVQGLLEGMLKVPEGAGSMAQMVSQ